LFFGLRLEGKEFHHSAIQTNIERHFGGFFHKITVPQPIRRQDSMQPVIRTSRRLGSILHEAAQNFEVVSNTVFSTEIKKSKTYSG
jgi:hypothetical protein